MQRITTSTRWIDKFGAGMDGFRDGDPPNGVASTELEAAWFDNAQEEIARVIELNGIALDGNDLEQLWRAIQRQIDAAILAIPAPTQFVLRAGDTMTGTLTVSNGRIISTSVAAGASVSVEVAGAGVANGMWADTAGALNFGTVLGDGTPQVIRATSLPLGDFSVIRNLAAGGTMTAALNVVANAESYAAFDTYQDFYLGAQTGAINSTAINFAGLPPNNFSLEYNRNTGAWAFLSQNRFNAFNIAADGNLAAPGDFTLAGAMVIGGGGIIYGITGAPNFVALGWEPAGPSLGIFIDGTRQGGIVPVIAASDSVATITAPSPVDALAELLAIQLGAFDWQPAADADVGHVPLGFLSADDMHKASPAYVVRAVQQVFDRLETLERLTGTIDARLIALEGGSITLPAH